MQIYLNVKQVAARYGLDTSTIWRKRKTDPSFPLPIKMGPTTVRWKLADLEVWEASRVIEGR